MLKEIVIAIQAYFKAHRFIRQHNLWKWIIIPGLIYCLMFAVGIYVFWKSSNAAINYLSDLIGLKIWLQKMENGWLSFFFIIGELILRILLLFFYFSLFKYLFLIIGSPVFAYLSEKTEAIIDGKEYPFSWKQLGKDIIRGIRLALRNTLWQTLYTFSILLLSLIPIVGWATPILALFVECYYYGFSMLDYSCERHKLSPQQSIEFVGKHRGLAIGNGLVFYALHGILVVGWIFAPAYAVVAATISLYHQKDIV